MSLETEILTGYSSYVQQEITRLVGLFSFLGRLKTSTSSKLKKSNSKKLKSNIKSELASYGVSVEDEEVYTMLDTILKSLLDSTPNPGEGKAGLAVYKILEIIGTCSVLNSEYIYDWAKVVAKKLIVLLTFESVIIESIIGNTSANPPPLIPITGLINEIHNTLVYQHNKGLARREVFVDIKEVKNFPPNYYANILKEAETSIDKLILSAEKGNSNSMSVDNFKNSINTILQDENVSEFTSEYNKADNAIRKLIVRADYLSKIHSNLMDIKDNFGTMVDIFINLEIGHKFSTAILNNIKDKVNYWNRYFNTVEDKTKFTELRNTLLFLSTAKQTVEGIFDPSAVDTTAATTGTVEWVNQDGSYYSNIVTNTIGTPTIGDKIGFHTASIDSDNYPTEFTILSFTTDNIILDNRVLKPTTGTTLYYCISDSARYCKYKAVSEYINNIDLPDSFDLGENHSTSQFNDIRKILGEAVWEFITQYGNKYYDITLHEQKVTAIVTKFTDYKNIIDEISSSLGGYCYPSLQEIELVDDILQEYDLDTMRDNFLNGEVKKFFSTTLNTASSKFTIISKINDLVKN
jgi:hypothetical protein